VDEILLKKIEQKIQETISNKDDVKQLIQSLSSIDDSQSFVLGIIVGRIYNAFYYHTKRMFNREPTNDEFQEFLEFVKKRKSDFENLR